MSGFKQKILCNNCLKEYSKANFKKHNDSCIKNKEVVSVDPTWFNTSTKLYHCPVCDKGYSEKGIGTHIWRSHTENGKDHKNKISVNNEIGNHVSWNKGLSKLTDKRIADLTEKSIQTKIKNGTLKQSRPHSEETKQKLSKIMSVNNKGGRCKWFDVDNQRVQGTWERDIAIKLTEMGIVWEKLKTNRYTFSYHDGIKIRSYTPDFYLKDYDLFLEIKGYWWGKDKEKMKLVFEQNPNSKIIIIQKNEFEMIMRGELVW